MRLRRDRSPPPASRTVVLEADRIGAAARRRRLGLIREDFDASFQDTAGAHGLRAARTLWQGLRRASLDFAAAIKRAEHPLRPRAAGPAARGAGADADAVRRLRREYDARRAAGFDHTWMTAAALAREASLEGGARHPDARLRVRSISRLPGLCRVGRRSRRDVLRADTCATHSRRPQAGRGHRRHGHGARQAVVIATGASLPDLRALRRHLHPQQSYAVVTEPLPAAVQARARPARRGAARQRQPAAFPALAEGRSRAVCRRRSAARAAPRARQDARPALGTADVRAVDDLPGDLRRHARVVLGS